MKKKPFLHDKLEFQVIPTCFNFNIDDEIKKIIKNKKEILIYKKTLKNLTSNILNKNFLPYKFDLNQISRIDSILKNSNEWIKPNTKNSLFSSLLQNLWHLTICRDCKSSIYNY